MSEMTYEKAGVSIRREEFAVKKIGKILDSTFKCRENRVGKVMEDIGAFANVLDMGEFALAIATDGVGSKVLVAQELEKYDTIGIDLIAMNVNDVICLGAEPVAMVDYLALQQVEPKMTSDIAAGLCEGAKLASIAVVGGETATLPEVICGIEKRGFDLAGTVIGIVKKDRIITGENVAPGDHILGLESSGIHSNGMTLARKLLPKNFWFELLKPTRIYVKEVMELLQKFKVHGLVNITGGGFTNLQRVTEHGFLLDEMPEPQMVFKKMQELGNISDREMYRTFNMGIGFCLIVDKEDSEKILEEYGKEYKIKKIGSVVEEKGVTVVKNGEKIALD